VFHLWRRAAAPDGLSVIGEIRGSPFRGGEWARTRNRELKRERKWVCCALSLVIRWLWLERKRPGTKKLLIFSSMSTPPPNLRFFGISFWNGSTETLLTGARSGWGGCSPAFRTLSRPPTRLKPSRHTVGLRSGKQPRKLRSPEKGHFRQAPINGAEFDGYILTEDLLL